MTRFSADTFWRLARWPILLGFLVLNVGMFYGLAQWAAVGLPGNDWSFLTVDPGDAYSNGWYKWSVPAAALWAYAIAPLGFAWWSVLHFAALLTLPRTVALVALVTFPFWRDVAAGNVLTFCFVLAWHALEGRRWAVVGFCLAAVLIPRPIMLPVLGWLLLRRTDARLAFAYGTLLVVGSAAATGQLTGWLSNLLGAPAHEVGAAWDIGPSRFLGYLWFPIGLVVAAFAFRAGRLGIASLAISPYLIHYYAVFGLLELHDELRHANKARHVGSRATGSCAHGPGPSGDPRLDAVGV